jgi:hypothetical protein
MHERLSGRFQRHSSNLPGIAAATVYDDNGEVVASKQLTMKYLPPKA